MSAPNGQSTSTSLGPTSGYTAPASSNASAAPAIVAYTQRERARALLRSVFPRRRARVILTRSLEDFDSAFKTNLVDAAVVDVGSAQEETWRVAELAREYPSAPFFGLAALRAAEAPALAQCATLEFTDVLVDGVDDTAARDIVHRHSFSSRFAQAAVRRAPEQVVTTSCVGGRWRVRVSPPRRRAPPSSLP